MLCSPTDESILNSGTPLICQAKEENTSRMLLVGVATTKIRNTQFYEYIPRFRGWIKEHIGESMKTSHECTFNIYKINVYIIITVL